MASVTWHELRFGVGRLPRGKRQRELTEFLDEVVLPTIPTLAYDERAAAWHADERVRLVQRPFRTRHQSLPSKYSRGWGSPI